MNIKKIKTFFSRVLTIVHVISVILMVIIGLLSLFRPDLMRVAIEWMGMHIKAWGNWNYLILLFVAMGESFPFVGAVLPGMNIIILVG